MSSSFSSPILSCVVVFVNALFPIGTERCAAPDSTDSLADNFVIELCAFAVRVIVHSAVFADTNVLGAAILMPQKEIDIAMRQFACGRVLKNFEGRFNYIDRLSLTLLCQALGVSKSAAIIRLRQLGYIEDRPLAEYDDPLEVWL